MKINVNDKIPEFTLPDSHGKLVSVPADFPGKYLVIFFYPKDHSPGCTAQACAFRDAYEDFVDMGATVIGISSDTVDSHVKFVVNNRLPYTILSDTDKTVRNSFGVPSDLLGILPGRVTYIVDLNGVVRHIFKSQLNTSKHIEKSLEIIKSISNA